MDYHSVASGTITIPKQNIDRLCLAVRLMLNVESSLEKRYPWIDSKTLIQKCKEKDVVGIFKCWGFLIKDGKESDEFTLDFSDKTRDAPIFLKKIAPYVLRGEISWLNEEGCVWKNEFRSGLFFRVCSEQILH